MKYIFFFLQNTQFFSQYFILGLADPFAFVRLVQMKYFPHKTHSFLVQIKRNESQYL